jgi:putative membrane protein
MQFLKGLFWFLLAVVLVVFAFANWTTVPIKLWGGLVAEVNLPMLLLVMFLLGLVPTLLYHHAVRWRLRNRLVASDRTITELRAAAMAPSAPHPTPIAEDAPIMPPGAA